MAIAYVALFFLSTFAAADLLLSSPKIANLPIKVVEQGSSPSIAIQYMNTTAGSVQIKAVELVLEYDPQTIDTIIGIKNAMSGFNEKEVDIYNPGRISYKLELPSGGKTLDVDPGSTIDIARIVFHINQSSPIKAVNLFSFSIGELNRVIDRSDVDQAGVLKVMASIMIERSLPPKFSGIDQVNSKNSLGMNNIGNTLLVDWATSGTGAFDRSKFSNGKLSYRIIRSTDPNLQAEPTELSTPVTSTPNEDPANRAPYTGNAGDYVYQDGPGDGTPGESMLSDGTTYYYKVTPIDDTAPAANEETNARIASGIPIDLTPPGEVLNLTAKPDDNRVTLRWNNPADPDLGGIVIIKNAGSPSAAGSLGSAAYPDKHGPYYDMGTEPFGPEKGMIIFVSFQSDFGPEGVPSEFDDYTENGKTNYYKVFTYDRAIDGPPREMGRNYSKGSEITGIAGKAPRPVTNFKATKGSEPGEVVFSWKNSPDDFCEGTLIRFSSDDQLKLGALPDEKSGELALAYPAIAGPKGQESVSVIFPPGSNYYFKAFAFNRIASGLDPYLAESMAEHRFSSGQSAAIQLALETAKAGLRTAAVINLQENNGPAPVIKLWLDNKLYRKELVQNGEKFTVSSNPEIKMDVSVDPPYSLPADPAAYTIILDPGSPSAKKVSLSASSIVPVQLLAATAGEENKLRSLTIKKEITEPLESGEHILFFSVRSSGDAGASTILTETVKVEVIAGPLRLIGEPLTYPNPVSLSRQKQVNLQYKLSAAADIDIYIIGSSGIRFKKFSFYSGSQGGLAGLNNISWDGRTDDGMTIGNAIYIGTILVRNEGRLLGKFKLTVAD